MADQNLSSFIWSVADLLRGDYKRSDFGKVVLPFTVLRRLVVLQRRERHRGRRIQPRFRLSQIGVTSLGGLTAVGLMAMLTVWSGEVLIVAPLGASCVLLFGYPRSPLAQPRNVVLGNTLGASIGIALVSLLGQGPLVLALAVAFTILLGQQLRCLHRRQLPRQGQDLGRDRRRRAIVSLGLRDKLQEPLAAMLGPLFNEVAPGVNRLAVAHRLGLQ